MYQQPVPRTSMVQRFARRFVWLLSDSDFEYTEAQSPFAKVLWGLWLLNPYWNTFGGAKAYSTMESLAPEHVWGAGFLLIGAIHLLAIGVGYYKSRLVMALGGVFIWTSVSAMFAQTSIASTGVPVYSLLALGAGWSFWRLRVRQDSDDE